MKVFFLSQLKTVKKNNKNGNEKIAPDTTKVIIDDDASWHIIDTIRQGIKIIIAKAKIKTLNINLNDLLCLRKVKLKYLLKKFFKII